MHNTNDIYIRIHIVKILYIRVKNKNNFRYINMYKSYFINQLWYHIIKYVISYKEKIMIYK